MKCTFIDIVNGQNLNEQNYNTINDMLAGHKTVKL